MTHILGLITVVITIVSGCGVSWGLWIANQNFPYVRVPVKVPALVTVTPSQPAGPTGFSEFVGLI